MSDRWFAKAARESGHPYDEENTYRYRGSRQCQICRKRRRDEYHAKRLVSVRHS